MAPYGQEIVGLAADSGYILGDGVLKVELNSPVYGGYGMVVDFLDLGYIFAAGQPGGFLVYGVYEYVFCFVVHDAFALVYYQQFLAELVYLVFVVGHEYDGSLVMVQHFYQLSLELVFEILV